MNTPERIILGIDPGTNIMGYGVIKAVGKNPLLVSLGISDMRKEKDPYKSLQIIFRDVINLIDRYHPDELAIEAPFFGKNVQSMLKLGRAQGVAIAAALSRDIPIFEYAPRKIKMAITGQGNASKEQVADILCRILQFKPENLNLDATDGLAAALCHFYQAKPAEKGKNFTGWKDFIAQNPGRLK
ncbi:MAG: crossover junction endodeoxyribonuclease RuvC [Bacteroidales bacterium]|nr:crossover junction endodeoxyribonuclease RuvC [Bacteroidales bacterium]MCB8998634.1 crossover junction endodeoxyribonuclease RuvC [Bacteroidales bacterium]MCB9012498.1 crossover junction endodeoxyribonuclease RuvC [Bacteroidales bacterium]